MRVVVNAPARADHSNCLPAQFVLTNSENITWSGRIDRSAALGKDILSLVPSAVATWRLPGIGNLIFPNSGQRHRNLRWWCCCVEPRDSGIQQQLVANTAHDADEQDQRQNYEELNELLHSIREFVPEANYDAEAASADALSLRMTILFVVNVLSSPHLPTASPAHLLPFTLPNFNNLATTPERWRTFTIGNPQWPIGNRIYSYLSASIGSNAAAFRAG